MIGSALFHLMMEMALNRFAAVFGRRRKTGEEQTENYQEAKEEYVIRSGALLLEKQISYGHGKASNSRPVRIFSTKEIQIATNNFDDSLIFDRKATTKYRGTLDDGRVVAIKSPWGQHPFRPSIDFMLNEVAVNQIINHKNVLKLHGCCLETKLPILVHEFLPNGKLSDHIYGRDGVGNIISIPDFNIPWSESLRIAADISHALSYMHLALPKPIVHMGVWPGSIYLDESFNAKLTNFGDSVSISPGEDFISEYLTGTEGYIDPEYMGTRRVTEKCDVYGFGIILAELLTGKSPWTVWRQEGRKLADYFTCCLEEANWVSKIVHPRVLIEAASDEIQAFAGLALRCVASKGEERPTMREVTIELRRMHLAATQRQT